MRFFENLTVERNASNYLNGIEEKALFIYSPTSLNRIVLNNDNLIKINTHEITKEILNIDKIIHENKNIKMVISFGGGTATDIAKYISAKTKAFLICIPTMLSTNAYSTDKAALIINNSKITLDAKLPDEIILDKDLLSKAEKQNLYGVADILSIHTALYDWRLSEKENNDIIDKNIFKMSEDLVNEVIEFILEKDLKVITKEMDKLYNYIGMAGHITNIYGSGKPESGSEHIFAKLLESKIEIPHGISVSIGIILMSIIQNNYSDKIMKCIKKLKILEDLSKYSITIDLLRTILSNLIPRSDRYSIIDEFEKTNDEIENLLSEYQRLVSDCVVNN